ncbi:MAG: hypothetical protein H6574_21620 [Lewinellaceae bacterium]|nr:hypothetical protein [Lewinellaceae bacterium]
MKKSKKSTTPRNSVTVPFCLTESIKKSDLFSLNLTELELLKTTIRKPLSWESLPYREFVDFLIHRIMIHFDLILQDSVKLEKNGKVISRADSNWHFYKDYWKGYIKIIQARNRGLNFKIKYIGRNKKIETEMIFTILKLNLNKNNVMNSTSLSTTR